MILWSAFWLLCWAGGAFLLLQPCTPEGWWWLSSGSCKGQEDWEHDLCNLSGVPKGAVGTYLFVRCVQRCPENTESSICRGVVHYTVPRWRLAYVTFVGRSWFNAPVCIPLSCPSAPKDQLWGSGAPCSHHISHPSLLNSMGSWKLHVCF